MKILKKALLLFGAVTAVVGVAACSKEKDENQNPSDSTQGTGNNDGNNPSGGNTDNERETKLAELRNLSANVVIPSASAIVEDFTVPSNIVQNGVEYRLEWTIANDEHVQFSNNTVSVTRPAIGESTASKTAQVRIYYPESADIYYDFTIDFNIVPEQQDARIEELIRQSVNVKIPANSAIVKDFTLPEQYTRYDDNFNEINYRLVWTIDNDEHVEFESNKVTITRPEIGYAIVSKTANVRMFYPGSNDIYYDFTLSFQIIPTQVDPQEQINVAVENIYIPANLDAVVNDINLPTVTYFDTTEFNIQWDVAKDNGYVAIDKYDKEEPKVEVMLADITRPAIGEEDVNITLTANVSGTVYVNEQNGSSVQKLVTATKDFTITIKAERQRNTYDFTDDFTTYEEDTYFSDIQSPYWEYIEENKRIKEAKIVDEITDQNGAQINSLVGGKNALQLASSSVNEGKYDSYVSFGDYFVMESYLLSVDGGNKFEIDYRAKSSSLFKVGINKGEFTLDGKSTGVSLDEGVWYKVRMVFDNGTITYSYYDYSTGDLVTIGTKNVAVESEDIVLVRFSIPALEDAGLSYISDFKICHELAANAGTNPNRTDGLGIVYDVDGTNEVEFDNFVVVDIDSNYTVPSLAVYNRFLSTEKYTEGTDYTITTTITDMATGEVVNSITTGEAKNYKVEYVITLVKNAVEPAETKKFERIISVQDANSKSEMNNISFSTIKGGNMTVKADLTRENTTIYYYISDTQNTEITAEFIKNNGSSFTVLSNRLNTSLAVGNASIGKYIYITTVSDNGILGDVYKKVSDGVEEAMTNVNMIKTADQFLSMCTNTDTANDLFQLANDIDMTGKTWGQSSVVFGGTLDGNGYTVRNIYNVSNEIAGGLFYSVNGGTVKNIRFENCEIIASAECGLFGKESVGGTFEDIELVNLTVFGNNLNDTTGYVGALAGRARTTGETTTIKKVSLINDKDHYIKSSRYTGGLLGGVENAICNISDCYIVSTLIDERQCTGGIVGRAKLGSQLTITNCIVNVTISSYKYAGFILGENELSGTTGTRISHIVISGTIAGGETNKKNFGLIAGRLQGKFVSIDSILSLGAILTTNSLGEIIDNSPDSLVHQLDTGIFSPVEKLAVALNQVPNARYMYFENTGNALKSESSFKQVLAKYQIDNFDWVNTWSWTSDVLGIKHN